MRIGYKVAGVFFILTISLFFAVVTWQSIRCNKVEEEITRLETEQEAWINASKRLIAGGASFMSAARIELAAKKMGLEKVPPENVIQVLIYEGM